MHKAHPSVRRCGRYVWGHRATTSSVLFGGLAMALSISFLWWQATRFMQANDVLQALKLNTERKHLEIKALTSKLEKSVTHAVAKTQDQGAAQNHAQLMSSLHTQWPYWLSLFETQLPNDVALLSLTLDPSARSGSARIEAKNAQTLYWFADKLAHSEYVQFVRPSEQAINDKHPLKPTQLQLEIHFNWVATP